ncbi:MAG: putative lipid II flippase FtsW [Actinomycetota bacterium]|jgi:cell division protein FtsW
MSANSTLIGDRRRQASARAAALRRHPTAQRSLAPPNGPPPTAYYVTGLVVAVFVMLGLVMVLSASSIQQFHKGYSPWRIFNRQAVWAVLGTIALWVCAKVPYTFWRRLVVPGLIGASALMMLPFVPGIGTEVNGARAWVSLGSLSFQPSEFLKLAVLLYCADLLTRRESEMHDLRRTLAPTILVAALGSGMCMLQADLGTAIVLGAIVFAVAFIGGTPLVPMLGAGAASTGAAMFFVFASQRRFNRFTAFLDITGNRDHLSYQTYQAMIAVAQGGTTGAGPGRGLNKLGDFLPLAHSDFIFAVIAEELGLIGVVAVVGGFVVLTYCGVQIALAARDRFGMLLAGGIVGWFVVQTVINIGGVIGLMPVTGLTLPFFSAGGSSLFVCMAAVGLLLNVARHAK